MVNEKEILEAALLGYRSQIGALQDKMREIVARLNPEPAVRTITRSRLWLPPQPATKPRRKFSAETRAKMAASQKKRWRLLKRAA